MIKRIYVSKVIERSFHMMGKDTHNLQVTGNIFPPQIEKLPQEESLEIVAFIFLNQRHFYLPTFNMTLCPTISMDVECMEGPQKLWDKPFLFLVDD